LVPRKPPIFELLLGKKRYVVLIFKQKVPKKQIICLQLLNLCGIVISYKAGVDSSFVAAK
jgi:hypothetical protein